VIELPSPKVELFALPYLPKATFSSLG